jgi:hypothetical protein
MRQRGEYDCTKAGQCSLDCYEELECDKQLETEKKLFVIVREPRNLVNLCDYETYLITESEEQAQKICVEKSLASKCWKYHYNCNVGFLPS